MMPTHRDEGPARPLERLDMALPPMLAAACGYRGDAPAVGMHWSPAFGTVLLEDGVTTTPGDAEGFRAFADHPAVARRLARHDLGDDNFEAVDWLLADLARGALLVGHAADVRRALAGSAGRPREVPPAVTMSVDELRRLLVEYQVDQPGHTQRRRRERREVIDSLVAWLDRHAGR